MMITNWEAGEVELAALQSLGIVVEVSTPEPDSEDPWWGAACEVEGVNYYGSAPQGAHIAVVDLAERLPEALKNAFWGAVETAETGGAGEPSL